MTIEVGTGVANFSILLAEQVVIVLVGKEGLQKLILLSLRPQPTHTRQLGVWVQLTLHKTIVAYLTTSASTLGGCEEPQRV